MAYCYEKKTDRKGNIYIEITGYEGSIRHLVIPAMMENIPGGSVFPDTSRDNRYSGKTGIL